MTINDLYIYFKCIHLCNVTGCEKCKIEMTGFGDGGCPLDKINKDKVREYLYHFADKMLTITDKDYSVDEESLAQLLMTDITY